MKLFTSPATGRVNFTKRETRSALWASIVGTTSATLACQRWVGVYRGSYPFVEFKNRKSKKSRHAWASLSQHQFRARFAVGGMQAATAAVWVSWFLVAAAVLDLRQIPYSNNLIPPPHPTRALDASHGFGAKNFSDAAAAATET